MNLEQLRPMPNVREKFSPCELDALQWSSQGASLSSLDLSTSNGSEMDIRSPSELTARPESQFLLRVATLLVMGPLLGVSLTLGGLVWIGSLRETSPTSIRGDSAQTGFQGFNRTKSRTPRAYSK